MVTTEKRERNSEQKMQCSCPIRILYRGGKNPKFSSLPPPSNFAITWSLLLVTKNYLQPKFQAFVERHAFRSERIMLSISISSSTPLLKTHHHHPEWWQKWLMGSAWQHCLLMSETQWKTRYSLPHHHQGWVPSQFGLYSYCWMSAPWTQLCSRMKLEGGNDMNHLSIKPVYWWDSHLWQCHP